MWEPQELLRQQYAAVGSAAIASLTETVASPENLGSKNGDALPLIEKLATNRSRESPRGLLPSMLLPS